MLRLSDVFFILTKDELVLLAQAREKELKRHKALDKAAKLQVMLDFVGCIAFRCNMNMWVSKSGLTLG